MARCLASDCEIVSGGALGVDGAAHEGALDAGGRTLVVLGTGIDVAYPVRHAPLFERVRAHGALLSPFAPGTPPRPGHFPARNRVIAALADVVVVVEASIVSGSMGTARMAREAGRLVAAVPGSPGTDHLLAEGAHGVVSAEDVRALLDGRPVEGTRRPDARSLDGTARSLYEALGPSPMDLGELASRARLSIAVCAATVVELEAGGFAARATGGRYQRLS
jgi:DNA processing protein